MMSTDVLLHADSTHRMQVNCTTVPSRATTAEVEFAPLQHHDPNLTVLPLFGLCPAPQVRSTMRLRARSVSTKYESRIGDAR